MSPARNGDRPSPPWTLACAWCSYSIDVNARGAHGKDPGAGVEAARYMTAHVENEHGRTWQEYLDHSVLVT